MFHSEHNSHIYVHKDDMWAVKGRFSQALKDDDPVQWMASSDNKFTLSLLAVSILLQDQFSSSI